MLGVRSAAMVVPSAATEATEGRGALVDFSAAMVVSSAATEATEGWRAAEGRRAAADANGWFANGLFAIGLFATRRGSMSPRAEEGALAPFFFYSRSRFFFLQVPVVLRRLPVLHTTLVLGRSRIYMVWESGCGAMYNPDDKGP